MATPHRLLLFITSALVVFVLLLLRRARIPPHSLTMRVRLAHPASFASDHERASIPNSRTAAAHAAEEGMDAADEGLLPASLLLVHSASAAASSLASDPAPNPPAPAPVPTPHPAPTPDPIPVAQPDPVPPPFEPDALQEPSSMHIPSPPPAPVGFEAAAPWTAPPGTSFTYLGLEDDLDALLQVQASPDQWITIITMSGEIKRFVLNCVYTLHKYASWPHFILVTFDGHSLQVCKELNLPCFDGAMFATGEISDGGHNYGSGIAIEIWWAKQRMATELLRKGYNVHGSDADVVYFRNLHLSYAGIFQKTDADAIFATEEWIWGYFNLINAGVYAVRSNERSVRFFEQWTADTELGKGGVDQQKLNQLFLHGFLLCDSATSCQAVQSNGKFSIFRHKSFFPGNYCIEDSLRPTPCDLRRMYLHQLCIHGWEDKAKRWDMLNLWFIDENLQPMFADGGGANGAHAFMPCKDQVAWEDVEQGTTA